MLLCGKSGNVKTFPTKSDAWIWNERKYCDGMGE